MPIMTVGPLLILIGPSLIGGVVELCRRHPNPFCIDIDGNVKRDIIDMGDVPKLNVERDSIDMSDVPKLNVERAAVGPCNIPMYNFDLCRGQVKSQTIQIVSSIPSPGGKCSHPTMAMASYIERVKWVMQN